ncbi:hypothetical protein D1007_12901 [Hordeum vulgare]|nr:hypothetical protein D1007_12901 [Hordeum vulgare]
MEDMTYDEPAPPSTMHSIMTIGKNQAHDMGMVKERFQEAHADAAYNLHILEEHRWAEERLDASRAITPDAGVREAALLESYCSTREIRLNRWRYHQRHAELEATYKEFEEAAREVWANRDD